MFPKVEVKVKYLGFFMFVFFFFFLYFLEEFKPGAPNIPIERSCAILLQVCPTAKY